MYWAYLDWWDYERRERLLDDQRMITSAAYGSYAHHRPRSIQEAQRALDARMRRPPPWATDQASGLTDHEREAVAEIIRRMRTQKRRPYEPGRGGLN